MNRYHLSFGAHFDPEVGGFPTKRYRSWGWIVALGAALTMLGLIASANLFLATMAATYVAGAMMFAGGVLQFTHGLAVRRWTWASFWLLSGLLYAATAAAILYDPLFAARLLTLFLCLTLAAAGGLRASIALGARGAGWNWMFASGLVSLGVAAVIAIGWPANTLWLLGMVLAIDLLVQGTTLMLVGFAMRPSVT
jgi:uncharacterized membrane protein HdeD (DUF308 family)